MGAAGCRKNANFGGDSNPWALDTLNLSKNCKKMSENCSGEARTAKTCMGGERFVIAPIVLFKELLP